MQNNFFNFLFTLTLSLSLITNSLNLASELNPLDQAFLIKNSSDIAQLFPKTVDEIDSKFQFVKEVTTAQIQKIIGIPCNDRTFENTVLEFDKAIMQFKIFCSIISMVKSVQPDNDIRKKAEDTLVSCTDIGIDLFQTNKEIYQAFKEYESINKELLNEERADYFSDVMAGFKMAGFELEVEEFKKMQELRKEIAALGIQFQTNIAQDKSTICFTRDDLRGIDDEFINTLTKTVEGYILACDYPTAGNVISNCSVESTRRDYIRMFRRRGAPQNIDIINQIINKRDELAHLLGCKSYAELDISSTMAETIDRVETFLNDLSLKSDKEVKDSWATLMNDLPESVNLTVEGKIKLWDVGYLSNYYFKHHMNIDRDKIAEYFPMEETIRGLLDIYERFFDLKFKVINNGEFWDPSVQMIEVQNGEDDNVIGYVLVDLFPRENKESHACCISMISPMSFDKGQTFAPALAVVIANFSKSTENKPSLLKHNEVKTFFHEFGHAIHALSGKAEMPTNAGYNTKFDFVETPSQLLEEWIWDREILKNLSHHYQTGESLPDDIIELLLKTRNIKDAIDIDSQLAYSRLCLDLYKEGQNKDFSQLKKDAYNNSHQVVAYDDDISGLCSFVHLTGYGPKYYSYLWSEQLAKKIFNYIKLHGGLLDPVMGKRYISKVIGRGGSCDPNKLVDDFVGSDINVLSTSLRL